MWSILAETRNLYGRTSHSWMEMDDKIVHVQVNYLYVM